jgi:4-hydroxy-2-oxoheptanedioate aldolase
MELRTNHFKRAILSGTRQIGLWATLGSPTTVEIIAGSGFDWILIDTEHTPNDIETVLAQLRAAAPYPTEAVVRVPWNDMVTIKRYLDIGVQTLLIPYVSTAQEARSAVAFTRYPPTGLRGVAGGTRAMGYGRVRDYIQRAHEEICVLVQIETRQALDNIEEIAAVEGVDGMFIGPADLHASLGHPGEYANPGVLERIADAMARIVAAGKAPGFLTSERQAPQWLDHGALFVAVGSDTGILTGGADALARKFK